MTRCSIVFEVLTYLQFGLAAVLLAATPLTVLAKAKGYKYFGWLLAFLYFAQLFMYRPGADVSPYAFANLQINAIRVMGLTLSALVSIVLLAYIAFDMLLRRRNYTVGNVVMLLLALLTNVFAMLSCDSPLGEMDYLLKILAPFMIGFYLNVHLTRRNVRWFKRLVSGIQLMLIVQLLVCKVLEGSFAAYNYYYEMAEEYFGYYNHPHSFNGLLGFLCIWNIYEINRKEHLKYNLVMLLLCLVLMYISGVRTYLVALVAGMGYIGLSALRSSSMKGLRKYVYMCIAVLLIVGPTLISSFGAARVTDDFSSGRISRWVADIGYALATSSPLQILLGSGLEASVRANAVLSGVAINSLNLFVDMFMDYGIIGMILMIIAYINLFKLTWTKHTKGFQGGLLVMFFATCFINSIVSYITIMAMLVLILNIMRVEGGIANEGARIKSAAVSRGA